MFLKVNFLDQVGIFEEVKVKKQLLLIQAHSLRFWNKTFCNELTKV
jgi:hypothetical protein